MDRGLLVHEILDRFVKDEGTTEEELLAIAEEEFDSAEARGATGYHLLWEIEKEEIREGLRQFLVAEGMHGWAGRRRAPTRRSISAGTPEEEACQSSSMASARSTSAGR